MKDIPVAEVAAISSEVFAAATRIGCTHVSITGRIWPGGQISGPPEAAARFVEFSWFRAAVVQGRTVFEEADGRGYVALLNEYGLGEEVLPAEVAPAPPSAPPASAPLEGRTEITVHISLTTRHELERQAAAEQITVGELLDWKFQPLPGRASENQPPERDKEIMVIVGIDRQYNETSSHGTAAEGA